MDGARSLDLLQRCVMSLLCTHGTETSLILSLSTSFAHDPPLLRAASRALNVGESRRSRSVNTLLLACVKARGTVRRLRELMSHAPNSAFSGCNAAGETPLSAACAGVRAGDAPSLVRALTLAASPHSRAADWNRVAELYAVGRGVPQDYVQAVKWWVKAAALGDADSQCTLALMYAMGRGVPQDDVQAAAWY